MIHDLQEQIDKLWQSGQRDFDDFFLELTATLSIQNIQQQGGPFASLIVSYDKKNKPIILGVGANRVVIENDPSAHAEISAIRNATNNLGYTDLSNSVIFSSCECCPQCQAAVISVGITQVVFANTRQQADDAGFSDAEQYCHFTNINNCMSQSTNFKEKLSGHAAAILDENANAIAYGDCNLQSNDPTASLPSMNAIRGACKKINNYHLPANYTLITRDIIHPTAFTTADWARIGRVRNKYNPTDPSKDLIKKDSSKIIFINQEYEQLQVRDAQGHSKIIHNAQSIIHELQQTNNQYKLVKTHRSDNKQVLQQALQAFIVWKKLAANDSSLKY